MVERIVFLGGMRHIFDQLNNVVDVIDACVELLDGSIVVVFVGATIVVAHILLPSEVAIHRSHGLCPSRVANVALLRGAGGVDVVVEDVDKAIGVSRNTFIDSFAFEINISHQEFVEVLHRLSDDAVLRILVEEVIATCSA